MCDDQNILNEINSLNKSVQELKKLVIRLTNKLPDNIENLRISSDGAIEEVQLVCEEFGEL